MTATQFDTMGKEELRAACRTASISYSKLNNDGMRAALKMHAALVAATVAPATFDRVTKSEDTRTTADRREPSAAVLAAEAAADDAEIAAWDNGTPSAESEVTTEDGAYIAPVAANPFAALLGGVVAPVTTGGTKFVDGKKYEEPTDEPAKIIRPRIAKTPAPAVDKVIRKGYKIDKDRPMQNGVKRPSSGTVCDAVWDALEEKFNSAEGLVAADLPAIADAHAWNRTNVSCEYYAFRKFMGIKKSNVA